MLFIGRLVGLEVASWNKTDSKNKYRILLLLYVEPLEAEEGAQFRKKPTTAEKGEQDQVHTTPAWGLVMKPIS